VKASHHVILKQTKEGKRSLLVTKIPPNELLERRCSKQQVDTTSAGRSKQWRKVNLQQWWWLSISYIGDADRRAVVAAAVGKLQWWVRRRPTSISCGGGQHSGSGCRQAAVAAYKQTVVMAVVVNKLQCCSDGRGQ